MNKFIYIMCFFLGVGLVSIGFIQGRLSKESTSREAMLNEYEYLMADVWEENQELKKQLGVFYNPKDN